MSDKNPQETILASLTQLSSESVKDDQYAIQEGLNGVNCQLRNGLKFNCQLRKGLNFNWQLRKGLNFNCQLRKGLKFNCQLRNGLK